MKRTHFPVIMELIFLAMPALALAASVRTTWGGAAQKNAPFGQK